MEKRKQLVWLYIAGDYGSSLLAWYCLYMFRKVVIEGQAFNAALPFQDNQFFVGLIVVPQIWLWLNYISGTYTDLYRKSRLQELVKTAPLVATPAIIEK